MTPDSGTDSACRLNSWNEIRSTSFVEEKIQDTPQRQSPLVSRPSKLPCKSLLSAAKLTIDAPAQGDMYSCVGLSPG